MAEFGQVSLYKYDDKEFRVTRMGAEKVVVSDGTYQISVIIDRKIGQFIIQGMYDEENTRDTFEEALENACVLITDYRAPLEEIDDFFNQNS